MFTGMKKNGFVHLYVHRNEKKMAFPIFINSCYVHMNEKNDLPHLSNFIEYKHMKNI